jgi:hypothetical protein
VLPALPTHAEPFWQSFEYTHTSPFGTAPDGKQAGPPEPG